MEKSSRSRGQGRLAFLKTKRAIAVLTFLVVLSVVLIALGATHELTPHRNKSISNEGNLGVPLGSGNGSSAGGSSGGNSSSNGDGSSGSGDNMDGGQNSTSSGGNNGGNGNDNGSGNGDNGDNQGNHGNSTEMWKPKNSSSIADRTPLRIMCLGASIVRGLRSTDQNGFRKTLRDDLAKLGAPINMVGSQRNGDMTDNDFEAYSGNRIDQIFDHAKQVVPQQQPNIFVINIGTNNALQHRDVGVAGADLEAFIDYLLATSPRSTVIFSTLLTNTVPNLEPVILDINQQYRALLPKYENNTVVMAELHPSTGLPGRPEAQDIGPDGSHPTDHGYEIMGHILADAVKEADQRGYLRWPVDGMPYDGDIGRVAATAAPKTTDTPAPKPTNSAR